MKGVAAFLVSNFKGLITRAPIFTETAPFVNG
jgi:hypothetical protein